MIKPWSLQNLIVVSDSKLFGPEKTIYQAISVEFLVSVASKRQVAQMCNTGPHLFDLGVHL
jgi:hypothetical protein